MRTNLISFILSSEKRKIVVKTILEYPRRQWSCSAVEDLTKLPHATVYRTLAGLHQLSLLKVTKINKKDLIYELVQESPLLEELRRALDFEKITAHKIAQDFVSHISPLKIYSAILYGSSVTGKTTPASDIDVLVILLKHNLEKEKKIYDLAAEISAKINKTISVIIMNQKEIKLEKDKQFLKSVKENKEVLYGKEPF